jgi:rhodanese-related sulfurtransferase
VTVIDLSLSRDYRKGHITGAWFAIRSRLMQSIGKIALPESRSYYVGRRASRRACGRRVSELIKRPVYYLKGGNAAWKAVGYR